MHIDRGTLLLEQGRYEQAEQEFRRYLASEPEDPYAHALLSLALTEQEKYAPATIEAQEAIRYGPDEVLGHRALAYVLLRRNRPDEALSAARQALELDPYEAEIHSLLASIHLDRRDWAAALKSAEEGLALDAEHDGCQNLRAMALVKLGRRDEAGRTIGEALHRRPENALTHANRGWTFLHEGKPKEAMGHFREALRLDPNLEWARMGIVEALKAQNIVYRGMLLYFLWMARLSHQAQWGIIIGGYVGYQFLRNLLRTRPEWGVWIWPVLGLYIAFAVMTWVADPLFNLMLRLNRFGRLVLSRDQVVLSNWIGGLLLAAAALCGAAFLGMKTGLMAGLFTALMIVPVSAAFRAPQGWPRRAMTGFVSVLAALGIVAVSLRELGLRGHSIQADLSAGVMGLFLIGLILSPWVSNAVLMTMPKR